MSDSIANGRRGLAAPTGDSDPPSVEKHALIRRYLELDGTQQRIDAGSFLERYAVPGGLLTKAVAIGRPRATVSDLFTMPMQALRQAYMPHRQTWQKEYESHLNWEYSEDELRQILLFLESDAGRHFRTGEWRMNAYVGTNVEHLEEQIVTEAAALLRAGTIDPGASRDTGANEMQ